MKRHRVKLSKLSAERKFIKFLISLIYFKISWNRFRNRNEPDRFEKKEITFHREVTKNSFLIFSLFSKRKKYIESRVSRERSFLRSPLRRSALYVMHNYRARTLGNVVSRGLPYNTRAQSISKHNDACPKCSHETWTLGRTWRKTSPITALKMEKLHRGRLVIWRVRRNWNWREGGKKKERRRRRRKEIICLRDNWKRAWRKKLVRRWMIERARDPLALWTTDE